MLFNVYELGGWYWIGPAERRVIKINLLDEGSK